MLHGWGGAAPSRAHVVRPGSIDELTGLAAGPGATLARGLGRSYGDAAQCAGGTVIDCTGLDRILELDHDAGRVRVEAGCSLDALMRVIVPRGFFVPVTPGTRYVTVGGAIASDVHGKNHHREGTITAHTERLGLATPTGHLECSPDREPELFWATAGGMGLTGVITDATLRLLPIETSAIRVDTERLGDLDACMARMSETDASHRYSVAWIDSLARGRHLGRAVLSVGDHAALSDLDDRRRASPLEFDPRPRLAVPVTPPVSLLNSLTVAAFNEGWFRKAPRRREGELQTISAFFHPLDAVGRWNVLYGPRGFTQYQFVVPFGAERVVRTALERLSTARVASFLTVLKRFGDAGPGPLSFPRAGWTLALDLPLGTSGLPTLLDELDELVAEAGGRVYLAKDGRVRPEVLHAMYPRLAEWSAVRRRVDPTGVLDSDLAQRLGLTSDA
jgi:decaprenylphospho-beta-D-ribofuranose 2-oxidase